MNIKTPFSVLSITIILSVATDDIIITCKLVFYLIVLLYTANVLFEGVSRGYKKCEGAQATKILLNKRAPCFLKETRLKRQEFALHFCQVTTYVQHSELKSTYLSTVVSWLHFRAILVICLHLLFV